MAGVPGLVERVPRHLVRPGGDDAVDSEFIERSARYVRTFRQAEASGQIDMLVEHEGLVTSFTGIAQAAAVYATAQDDLAVPAVQPPAASQWLPKRALRSSGTQGLG